MLLFVTYRIPGKCYPKGHHWGKVSRVIASKSFLIARFWMLAKLLQEEHVLMFVWSTFKACW